MTASLSISMPQSEVAPKAPSAASTTPLPEPISSTLAPWTHAALARRTWIRAAVYSLGRSAAGAKPHTMVGLEAGIGVPEGAKGASIQDLNYYPVALVLSTVTRTPRAGLSGRSP